MNNLRQAAKQALEFCEFLWREVLLNDWAEMQREAVEQALRTALAEPEQPISSVTEAVTKTVIEIEKLLCEKLGRKWQASGMSIETLINELASRKALAESEQEPVAYLHNETELLRLARRANSGDFEPSHWTPLYAAPTPRKPLTDEEIDRVTDQQWVQNNHKPIYAAHRAYARAIERAHGIGEQT